jgi:hypothetical protein
MNNRPFNNEYFELYLWCEKYKALPLEGGIWDQPAKIMSAFSIAENIITEYRKQRGER